MKRIISVLTILAVIGSVVAWILLSNKTSPYVQEDRIIAPGEEVGEVTVEYSPLGNEDMRLDPTPQDAVTQPSHDDVPMVTIPCVADPSVADPLFRVALTITVNGTEEVVPKGIGVSDECTYVLNTRGVQNEICVEEDGAYTLGDFFAVWGMSIQRSGLGLQVYIDDELVYGARYSSNNIVEQPEEAVLKKGIEIQLVYTSKG